MGGPLASVYFIKQNFSATNNHEGSSKTLTYGGALLVALLCILPFIPEDFPTLPIPLLFVFLTKVLVEKYQFDKDAIEKDHTLTYHSNWRVFFIGVVSLIVFMAVIFIQLLMMESLGIITLA
ncbi:hypothetical protein C9I90_04395 [Photobacterium aphoticum]|uniref:Uncharacterized protein n=1 Tax=Photobacterium aphoticum TaxID=754436 RepID=A0A0J1GQ29_9GAMM|nr:hypothetical protein ABT58_04640 [Photobacterium aphoticum]PSU59311.1 hypothetical protein C9I90_04395 [Photobacterium aphoticum]